MFLIMYGSVSVDSSTYPTLLKEIPDPPEVLYYKGNWDRSLFDNCLAVVGSRRMTVYGRRVTEKLVYEVASRGVTVVSGFMYGIDATAHRASLAAKGKTIAVLACGVECINPDHQQDLYYEILDSGGLVISEYPGDVRPQLWTYPKRNRIVAGISQATLVVEAAKKSGSLITAGLTREFRRELLAVPGQITSSTSVGANNLISSGAMLVRNAEDILNVFGRGYEDLPIFKEVSVGDALRSEIVSSLAREPMDMDILCETLGLGASEVGAEITMLLLSGQIFEEGGKYYVD
ncbi:DNA-processing protein DprA [Patescibacteria group bacterium]